MIEKNDTMGNLNPYGNEYRIDLSTRLEPQHLEHVALVLDYPMHVLSCSYWNCFAPWHVTMRCLQDNFCLFVLTGTVRLQLETAEYILTPGEGFMLKTGMRHVFGLPPGEKKCSHIIMHALPGRSNAVNLVDQLTTPCHPIPGLAKEQEFLLDLISMINAGNAGAMLYCSHFLNQILIKLAKTGKLQFPSIPLQHPRLRLAIACIDQNYSSNIAIADVAAAAGIHEVYCRKLFREHLNMSPGEYLRDVRLFEAAKLLLNSTLQVKEVAWECGFSSDRYFCYAFKRRFNFTPEDYRQAVKMEFLY